MWKEHPSIEDFEGFLRSASGAGRGEQNQQVMRHLLAECPSCKERLKGMGWEGRRLERLLQLPTQEEFVSATGFDYQKAFAGAQSSLDAFFARECPLQASLEALTAELESLPADAQINALSSESRFAHPQVVHRLIDLSHAARYEDPGRMLHLARLARIAADSCTAEAAGSLPKLADVRTRAWGHFGNSLRVCGKLREAEEALLTAQQLRKQGTGDPLLRARLWEQLASLHTFQRRFESAIELADEAGQIYKELEEHHLLASSLVHKAIACLYSGEAESAALILNRAIPLIDHETNPHLLLAACHNLVRCYIDLDRPEQALSLYFEARELYQEFADALILLRAGWQEGQLLRDLGHLHAAESALLRARKGFMERSLSYEAAVVSLDLAAVYVKLGLVEELRQTVSETVPIFRALRVGREALASLLQLQQVADQEHQALGLIRFLTARLERLSNERAHQ